MFGMGRRDPFKGVSFPNEDWSGSTIPTRSEIREAISALPVTSDRRGFKSARCSLDQASAALSDWLAAEDASLRREAAGWASHRYFDVALCRSAPELAALCVYFRLKTTQRPGAVWYGGSVRRLGADEFVTRIEGDD